MAWSIGRNGIHIERTQGFMKIVVDADTQEIRGVALPGELSPLTVEGAGR
ncbi:MAG: hypothetical protein JJE04_06235 [Acidobacteriia bacterium]|nr:hypothetical protein [Terriglobia bacterium]